MNEKMENKSVLMFITAYLNRVFNKYYQTLPQN